MFYLQRGSLTPTSVLFASVWLSAIVGSLGQSYDLDSQWRMVCPHIYLTVFVGFAPRGNISAGAYTKVEGVKTLKGCIERCCQDDSCNVVFMYDLTCYQIMCNTSDLELCGPTYREGPTFTDHTKMVLVQPPNGDEWGEVIDLSMIENSFQERDGILELAAAESQNPPATIYRTCEYGIIIDCPPNETCKPLNRRSNSGLCECDENYVRDNSTRKCNLIVSDLTKAGNTNIPVTVEPLHPTGPIMEGEAAVKSNTVVVESSSTRTIKSLIVSTISKEVRLPENDVTLSAFVVPASQLNEPYNYEWKLLSQPEGSNVGTMNDQNGGTLKLSHLIEGLYQFKVMVSASAAGAYGETYANVTVLPAKRINKPPTATITPSSQTVKLPNTGAVLDGSTSKDDDSIVSWHWELQQGPIGYQPHLEDTPTLQLNNLRLPGNYTFKLTIEDSDHATNSTTANITVLKETDYPPEANAGQDIIVYLPHNSLTLNGNLSTDDRGIASWEWTKSTTDQEKAVDMQNTRTPYLQLANLEEGMYTFVLKVTDSSSQSSSATVHVFVKPPTNNPPTAKAGANVTVALPQTWVTLDGSQSSDDIKIVTYSWEILKGPRKVSISSANASVTNVTELTKGLYEFQLTVLDEQNNTAKDTIFVTVTQNTNARPKANGGGDQTVFLPSSIVILNGSQSSDDLGIVKWEWSREPNSLELGQIIANTDRSAVLMLTGVVPGRYIFRLRVTDDQGLTDEDTVSVIVKQDPHLRHLVELVLNIEGEMLTKAQEDSLEMKLALLLREKVLIHVQYLRVEDKTGRAVVVFYVERGTEILPGPEVVQRLKEKLRQDSGLLELSVASIQTVICQNNCSGHGVCDQSSRQCLCEAFWMQDLISKHLGVGDANCDWSILYVIIVLFTGVILVVGSVWAVACFCQRAWSRRPRKRPRYTPLDDGEDDAMIPRSKKTFIKYPQANQRGGTHEKITVTDTDSDSDVLFENRNGHSKTRNGFTKMGRRVKT